MPPSTRSSGAALSGRVYRSTAPPAQRRLRPQRKVVKTYGKGTPGGKRWNQQTLTQIDFMSSARVHEDDAIGDSLDDATTDEEENEENEEYEVREEESRKGKGKEKVVNAVSGRRTVKRDTTMPDSQDDEHSDHSPVKRRPRRLSNNNNSISGSSKQNRPARPQDPSSLKKRKRKETVANQEPKDAGDKRRRTLGDMPAPKTSRNTRNTRSTRSTRRKTLGDPPSSSAACHTQTLTQFLARPHALCYPEDDDYYDDGFEFDTFLPFDPKAPRATNELPQSEDSLPSMSPQSRQPSVIPETPAKRVIRFEIPSSSQLSTPMNSSMLARYGPADKVQETPSKGAPETSQEISQLSGTAIRKKTRVIEDSYGTESWGSTPMKRTPLRDITTAATESPSLSRLRRGQIERVELDEEMSASGNGDGRESSVVSDAMSTPTRPRRGERKEGLGQRSPPPFQILKTTPSPVKRRKDSKSPEKHKLWESSKNGGGAVFEIPDSDEEDGEFWGDKNENQNENENDEDVMPKQRPDTGVVIQDDKVEVEECDEGVSQKHKVSGIETQENQDEVEDSLVKLDDPSSDKENTVCEENISVAPGHSDGQRGQGLQHAWESPSPERRASKRKAIMINDSEESEGSDNDEMEVGPETQVALDKIAKSMGRSHTTTFVTNPVSLGQQYKITAPQFTREPTPPPARCIRKPTRHILTSSQILESQRVPLSVIQNLGEPSLRTDILLPIHPKALQSLVTGHATRITLPFKIQPYVQRFWLFDGQLLRYAALVGHAEERDATIYHYAVGQMYELNNPRDEEDIREEGWLKEDIGNYHFIPPAPVSQLMANFKHSLFDEQDLQETEGESESDEEQEQESSPPVPHKSKQTLPSMTPTASFAISEQVEAQLLSELTAQYSEQEPPSDHILVPSTPNQDITPRAQPRRGSKFIKTPVRPTTSSSSARLSSQSGKSNRQWGRSTTKTESINHDKTPTTTTATPTTIVRPSQATTASQASTPEKVRSSSFARCPSSHPTFQSYGSSPPLLSLPSGASLNSSQLLSKSQMLPDSLLHDDGPMPPEIWDSQ